MAALVPAAAGAEGEPNGGTPRPGGQAAQLQVSRVALFSSGVGYFEQEATVEGAATGELTFRTEQINDILKSLVLQDFGGGEIGIVSYASHDPVEKTLKSFAVDISGRPSLAQLLDQLRGEAVEVGGQRQLAGIIVSVESQEVPAGDDKIEVEVLNLLTDDGLQQVRLSEVPRIRLVNPRIDAELRKALAALAASNDADKKSVVIHFDGQGQRQVRASFLLEAPIWKTSYRLVLAEDTQPLLQGWATVENATESDWNDVRLSLVSGRPISFIMDLYTPLYVPRPVEELELYASLRPPSMEAGFGVFADAPPAMQRRGARAEAGRPMQPSAAAPARAADQVLERLGEELALDKSGVRSVATAQQAGEVFEYTIQTPVSIARQKSAMLPIINQEIRGEKLSIYNPANHATHPLHGLMMENTTDLHLMQGPVTLFDGNVYAGDAKLPDLKPGEKRLVAYALDLGMDVLIDRKSHPEELVSVRIARGTLTHRRRHVDERSYFVRNKDRKDRTVLIEQPYSGDWTLVTPKEPFERTQNLLRFRTPVPAGETAAQVVRLERVLAQHIAMSNIGPDVIQVFLRSAAVSPAVKEALEKAVALRGELEAVTRQRAAREKDVAEAVEEQARVRENLKTLQQTSDAYQRQIRKFDELETVIEEHRADLDKLRREEERRRAALEEYLLSIDVE